MVQLTQLSYPSTLCGGSPHSLTICPSSDKLRAAARRAARDARQRVELDKASAEWER